MEKYWLIVAFLWSMVHFLLIICTNRLLHTPLRVIGCVLASLFSGICAAWCLVPGFSFLRRWYWRWVFLMLTALIAFGFQKQAWRQGALFIVLHLAVGQLGEGELWAFLLSAAALCLLCSKDGMISSDQKFGQLTIQYGHKILRIKALQDTGNQLRDPITGQQVIVVDRSLAWELLQIPPEALKNPLDLLTMRFSPGLRLIPYRTIDSATGFLLGLRVDRLEWNGKPMDGILAFAPEQIGQEQSFQALAGGNI